MATKRQSPERKQQAIALWKAGRSQRWIADELNLSPATINAWVKGIEQDNAELVNAQVSVKQRLSKLPEQELNAVQKLVDERFDRLEWLNRQAMRNVSDAMDAECINQADFRARADTIIKAKETLVGKSPETAIQINNGKEPITEIRRTIIDPRNTDGKGISPAT